MKVKTRTEMVFHSIFHPLYLLKLLLNKLFLSIMYLSGFFCRQQKLNRGVKITEFLLFISIVGYTKNIIILMKQRTFKQ